MKECKKKSRKVTFFGLFGQGNLGNECTLQAIIYNLRRYVVDAKVSCICTGPEDVSKRHNISAYVMSQRNVQGLDSKVWCRHSRLIMRGIRIILIRLPMELRDCFMAFRILRGTEMLCVPGTGFLTDRLSSTFGWPYEIFKWSIIAKICRCKLLFVSVGTNKILSNLSKWFIKSALSLADYRSYRNSYSKQYLKSIGFNTNNDPIYPDLAFSLPKSMMPIWRNRDRQWPVIGVGLMDYQGQGGGSRQNGKVIYRDFIEKMYTFVKWLLEHNYAVRLLIGDLKFDSSAKQDLLGLIQNSQFNYDKRKIFCEPFYTVEELFSQLAKTDIVISPRFHNLLLALMINKPVIALSYHEKIDALMDEFELGEYCHKLDCFDVERLIGQFIELERNAARLKPFFRQKSDEFRMTLDKQYSHIFNDLS